MDRNVRKPRSRRGTVAVAIASSVAILVAVVVILIASAPQRPQRADRACASARCGADPNVVGLPLNEANASLRKAGLAIESKYLRARASGTAEPGTVLVQHPGPGEVVPLGMAVPLIVSAGPHPNATPDGLAGAGGTCDLMWPPPSPGWPPCVGTILLVPLLPTPPPR
jgi:hypothetical protein